MLPMVRVFHSTIYSLITNSSVSSGYALREKEWRQGGVGVGLWDATAEFFKVHPHFVDKKSSLDYVSSDGGKTWNDQMHYSNFFIARRSESLLLLGAFQISQTKLTNVVQGAFESPAWSAWFDHFDHNGGIFTHR